MNNKLLLFKRIFVLGIMGVFFGSTCLYAGPKPPKRSVKASTSAAHNHTIQQKKKPHHSAAAHAPAKSVSAKAAGSKKTTNAKSNDLIAQVNAEVARQTQAKAKYKTKQEWLAEYAAHPEELHKGTSMYAAFFNADQRVKKAEQNNGTVDPLGKQMSDIYRSNITVKNGKTQQEWIDEYKAHSEELHRGTPMYNAFAHADQRVKKAEKNNEPVDPLDRQMSDIFRANLTKASPKTQQDWINEYNAHPEELHAGTPMYKAFFNADQRVKKAEQNNGTVDPLGKQMSDIYRENTKRIAEAKTQQEWINEYNAHPEELRNGTPMYNAFLKADQRVKRAEKNNETVDPLDRQMSDIYRANLTKASPKTQQDWINEYNAHPEELRNGTPMYNAFAHADQRVKKAEQNNETVDPLDKQMSDIYRANLIHAKYKTKQEWLDEYNDHPEELHAGTPMYNAFRSVDQRVKKAEQNNETIDPLDKQMSDIYRSNTKRIAEAKTTQEVYDVLLQFLRTNRGYPQGRLVEYQLVYSRLHGGNKPTLSELRANPQLRHMYEEDPELNKLYQLDDLARAVRDGWKPWAELETQLNRAFNSLAAEEQTALRQMNAHYDQVWHDFPEWYEHNKENIILTPETNRAFEEILHRTTTRARGHDDGEIVQVITDLSHIELGEAGDGISYRVIYRGQVSQGIKSEDFHLVAEEQGVPLQISMRELFPQRVAHIHPWFEDGRLVGIELKEDVTPQDIQTFIDTILEKNFSGEWRVRMGQSEPGRPKIYFEQIDNEGGMDVGYALQIKIKTPSLREQRKHDPDFFRKFFGKYM